MRGRRVELPRNAIARMGSQERGAHAELSLHPNVHGSRETPEAGGVKTAGNVQLSDALYSGVLAASICMEHEFQVDDFARASKFAAACTGHVVRTDLRPRAIWLIRPCDGIVPQ